tara:strand:+ start:273 stop:614 length:342 start_codon:yes stop_codon:yes gene_type:complete
MNYVESDTNRDATIEVGDTYTIVAEQSGLSSKCIDCAYDAGELIYSERVEELVPPAQLVSGYRLKYHYHNGHTAVVKVEAGSLQDAISKVDPAYWNDPQMSGFKATQCTWMEE